MHLTDLVRMGTVLPAKLPPELMPTKGRSGSFGGTPPPTAPGILSFIISVCLDNFASQEKIAASLLVHYELCHESSVHICTATDKHVDHEIFSSVLLSLPLIQEGQ